MTHALQGIVAAAEIAVTGDSEMDHEELSQMATDLGSVQPGEEQSRAYLAVLLNSLGLYEEALSILEPDNDNAEDDGIDIAVLRNLQGVLVANHGDYRRALEILEEALDAARIGTLQRTKILVNLAAVSLRHGRVRKAASWVTEAREARDRAGDTAVDVLLTSVVAGIARMHGDMHEFNAATSALAEASKSRIVELGSNHPQALTAVANLAAVEFERAHAETSSHSQQRAIEVLETISQRLAAEFGADDQQTLVSMANFVLAELTVALEDGSRQNLRIMIDTLEEISRRFDSVLGSSHPQALAVSANLILAKQEAVLAEGFSPIALYAEDIATYADVHGVPKGILALIPKGLGVKHVVDLSAARAATDPVAMAQHVADNEIVNRVARENFQGPEWERLSYELATYGMSTVRSSVASGTIFRELRRLEINIPVKRLANKGIPLEDATELAMETVAKGLATFRDDILRAGVWSRMRTSLTQAFITQCVLQFPHVYRRWIASEQSIRPEISFESLHEDEIGQHLIDYKSDPVQMTIDRELVVHFLVGSTSGVPTSDIIRSTVILISEGYSVTEVADIFGLNPRQLEGALFRYRTAVRSAVARANEE